MHFAFPPRKSSNPPAYARRNNAVHPYLQNSRLRLLAMVALAVFGLMWITRWFRSGPAKEHIPYGTPGAVIITLIEPRLESDIKRAVKANREAYAEQHGYATFFPNSTLYPLNKSPSSWAVVPSIRHAMTLYPHTQLFFYLAPTALIMESQRSIETHIMDPVRLESLMIVDQPIVPPDSVIKTFSHLKGDRVDFVLAQDAEGLAIDSMIIRRGDWAKFFLDAWFDPIYRSYNFQKAELHALEHLVQWHGTILAKLALVPQRILNAYKTSKAETGIYSEGDFVLNFGGCARDIKRSCAKEMRPTIAQLARTGKGGVGSPAAASAANKKALLEEQQRLQDEEDEAAALLASGAAGAAGAVGGAGAGIAGSKAGAAESVLGAGAAAAGKVAGKAAGVAGVAGAAGAAGKAAAAGAGAAVGKAAGAAKGAAGAAGQAAAAAVGAGAGAGAAVKEKAKAQVQAPAAKAKKAAAV